MEKTEAFDLERYLSNGVQNIVKNALRATLKDPRETAFLTKYARASKVAEEKRCAAAERGEDIPPFLIASITGNCNLHCAGCYARENHMCTDENIAGELTASEWRKIFEDAKELGVGFILLAGGEPMIRRDVIEAAAEIPEILFPIFTNGTMMNDSYHALFDEHRNLLPVFSVEGKQSATDSRRGEGVYASVMSGLNTMREKHLTFGVSVTVTTENLDEVTSDAFLETLYAHGVKVVIYVEFVPVTEGTEALAPGEQEREVFERRLEALREKITDMLFISFPGDEKSSGGCLAAGRGFFHINPHGGAEPCPFSPFEDVNVRDHSLREAMRSPLFRTLRDGGFLMEDHVGGCVLFEKRDAVKQILGEVCCEKEGVHSG